MVGAIKLSFARSHGDAHLKAWILHAQFHIRAVLGQPKQGCRRLRNDAIFLWFNSSMAGSCIQKYIAIDTTVSKTTSIR